MNYPFTFNLKSPKSDRPTLIYLRASIKNEHRYLKYSTGEKINPKDWDFEAQFPIKLKGRTAKAIAVNSIISQLSRYSDTYQLVCARIEAMGDHLTVDNIKSELDFEFKKGKTSRNSFMSIYRDFLQEKENIGKISKGTLQRYKNIRDILNDFSQRENYKLTLSRINDDFYAKFVKYSRTVLLHKDNTLGRNIGFIITFMNWSAKKGYHHNYAYKDFEKPKSETDEIALTAKELEHLWNFEYKCKRLEKVRDVFVLGCATGMRYSDYSRIGKENIRNGQIFRNTQKGKSNLGIPLNKYSNAVLEKYDFELPRISSQKFRDYIKEACMKAGFTEDYLKTSFRGRERIEEKIKKYDMIGTHTARRTFITLSLEKGMRPDIVMSITGHKSYSSFKKYIKLSQKVREDEMARAWS